MANILKNIQNKLADNTPAIKQGGTIPSGHLVKENNPEQGSVDLGKLTGKNLIIGVPGAFTPPCSSHVPGYVENAEKLKAKGIKDIYVVAVNDAFTTQAWKEKLGAKDSNIHFLADDTSAFTSSVGLLFDASGLLGGPRSQRYVIVASNNQVEQIHVEEAAPDVKVTAADNLLQALN